MLRWPRSSPPVWHPIAMNEPSVDVAIAMGQSIGRSRRRMAHGPSPCRVGVSRAKTATREFHSQLLPRYARRTREIDDAILGCYLGGINSRRIRTALKPLLGERHLSKSAVSRIVGRLKVLFATWQGRDLSAERYAVIFLDGFHLKVRLAKRVVSVPVLAALGVTETGQKCLLSLRLALSEATTTWGAVVTDLQQRHLVAPLLLVVDGNGGLNNALKRWDGVRVQRCTTHKLENLKEHCPRHARPEMKRDYDKIIYAHDGLAARAAYDAFLKKWSTLCPAVATSLEEAGLELLTFYDFPAATWKSIQNPGIIRHRRRRADRAVWPRGVRADSTAEDRWPQAAAFVPREAVAESRVRT